MGPALRIIRLRPRSRGCLLFEMLSGRPLFGGETATDVITSVIHSEPAWDALPPDTPDRVRPLRSSAESATPSLAC